MSCWFSITSWRAMREWWCETETLDLGLEQILRSAKPIFCYGRKHITQAFRLLRFSKVANKMLLISAASKTAGISRGSLSETTQAGMACLLKCFPALFMTASVATAALLLQHQSPTFLFLALNMEKILLFARWNVFTELRVFGSKFLLGLCLMLLGSSAVCPSAF